MITGFIEGEETIQSVSDNISRIEIYRNTAWSTTVQINDTGDNYILGTTEKMMFIVRSGNNTILSKVLTNADYDEDENGYILFLSSAETDIAVGKYTYKVTLQRADGEYEPIIPLREFIIKE